MVWWLICVEHFDIVQFIIYLINLLHRAHKAKSIKFHTFSDTLIENRFIFLIKTMTFARESTYNNFFYKRSTCCSIQYFILICDAMRFDVAGKYDEFYHNFFSGCWFWMRTIAQFSTEIHFTVTFANSLNVANTIARRFTDTFVYFLHLFVCWCDVFIWEVKFEMTNRNSYDSLVVCVRIIYIPMNWVYRNVQQ